MKPGIHPEYKTLNVRLNDGTTYQTRSTMSTPEFVPDIDSSNHPFYTGKRQFVDTAGRVEKFMRRYGRKPVETTETDAPAESAA